MSTHFGLLSTYPPTQCGLATFTASLSTALIADGGRVSVVRSVERSEALAPLLLPPRATTSTRVSPTPVAAGPDVVGALRAGDPDGPARAAALLNATHVAIVQHEYGIYGGPDGAEVLELLDALEVPVVVVLHTVLAAPTPGQRRVLEAVVARADAVVTMSATARDRLARGYVADLAKVWVIPHGAPEAPEAPGTPGLAAAGSTSTTPRAAAAGPRVGNGAPTVLTWGLLGPGKGIEWGIEAMATLRDTVPAAQYVVAGQTHPKVLAHAGEAYRHSLVELVRRLGLEDSVRFEPHYRDAGALGDLIRGADVVLLPYDSTEQVTSGVLIEAVASLTPVVATRFPHAVELLGRGTGLLVPHRDPRAIADALHTVLTRPDLVAGMRRVAASTAPGMRWPAVAARYRALTDELVAAGVAA